MSFVAKQLIDPNDSSVKIIPIAGTSTTFDSNGNSVDDLLGGKINEPSSEGSNGQVLTTDGSGGRSWKTVSSGTADFEQLSNRPKYNGVLMSGSTNIPQVPTIEEYTAAEIDTLWDSIT